MKIDNANYYYQYENIVIGADYQLKDYGNETYIYAIDIENGKVLWVKEFSAKGLHNLEGWLLDLVNIYAYVDYQKDLTEFSLIKIDIKTGSFTETFKVTGQYTNRND